MRSYEEYPPLLEFLYRKTGVSLPELTENPGILED